MRVYQIDKVTRDVRVALDQNIASAQIEAIGDVDTLSLNEIIRSKISDGVKQVHISAPVHLLDGGYNFADSVYWMEKESGWVLLPEDFMRFIVFEMSDWSRPVYSVLNAESAEYLKQHSQFKGIRGTADRPVCFFAFRPEGRVIEFYSCRSENARVSRAAYLPYPCIDAYGGIEICERCYTSVIYTIAVLVLTAIGEYEKSGIFKELAKSALI